MIQAITIRWRRTHHDVDRTRDGWTEEVWKRINAWTALRLLPVIDLYECAAFASPVGLRPFPKELLTRITKIDASASLHHHQQPFFSLGKRCDVLLA